MKLMLGTTELADIPDDVASQLVEMFKSPGYMSRLPQVEQREPPMRRTQPLEDSSFVRLSLETKNIVSFELTVVNQRAGQVVNARHHREIFGA